MTGTFPLKYSLNLFNLCVLICCRTNQEKEKGKKQTSDLYY